MFIPRESATFARLFARQASLTICVTIRPTVDGRPLWNAVLLFSRKISDMQIQENLQLRIYTYISQILFMLSTNQFTIFMTAVIQVLISEFQFLISWIRISDVYTYAKISRYVHVGNRGVYDV